MAFVFLVLIAAVLAGAYALTPIIERFLTNYIKGLSKKEGDN